MKRSKILLFWFLHAPARSMCKLSLEMLGYKISQFSNTYEAATKEQSCCTSNWYWASIQISDEFIINCYSEQNLFEMQVPDTYRPDSLC